MHEGSLVAGLVAKVNEAAGDAPVAEVWITLGALTSVSGSHLAEHFATAVAGTELAKARLVLDRGEDVADPRAQEVILEAVVVSDH